MDRRAPQVVGSSDGGSLDGTDSYEGGEAIAVWCGGVSKKERLGIDVATTR